MILSVGMLSCVGKISDYFADKLCFFDTTSMPRLRNNQAFGTFSGVMNWLSWQYPFRLW